MTPHREFVGAPQNGGVLLVARSTHNGAKTRHRPQLSGPALRGSEGTWRVFEGLKTLLASRTAWDVRFPEASDEASIHCCQHGKVRFLGASDGASIHRYQPGNVRFLEASDGSSIHRCQPGSVRFLEASDGATWEPRDWITTIIMQPAINTQDL